MSASIYAIEHTGFVLSAEECGDLKGTDGQPLFKTLVASYHYSQTGTTLQVIHFDPPLPPAPVQQAIEAKLGVALSSLIRMSKITGPKGVEDSWETQKRRPLIRYTLFMNKNTERYGSFMANGLKTDIFGCRNPDYVPEGQWEGFYTGSDATCSIAAEDE